MPTTAAKTAKTTAPAVTGSQSGLQLSAYRGDGAVLLAFNLKETPKAGFAGFSVKCTPPSGKSFYLKNRLTFDQPVTSGTTPAQRHAQLTGTDQAPYQKFRWIDFSSSHGPGTYVYEVSDLYHGKNGALKPRAIPLSRSTSAPSRPAACRWVLREGFSRRKPMSINFIMPRSGRTRSRSTMTPNRIRRSTSGSDFMRAR